ncbi:formate--tetrahydrofolate ligase [Dermacoccaceae bacterium W4C1]
MPAATPHPSDIEIATAATVHPIGQIAAGLGIPHEAVIPYGHDKAKVDLGFLERLSPGAAKLVLVTAMSPTPAGEGKTTTTVGLTDALNRLGSKAIACLREPSMGPVFGMKGGAAGGGYAQVVPMVDINLHFTGDFAAITAAHNLLAALIDNHLHAGNALDLEPASITWRRVLDANDRALRQIVTGLGAGNGTVRETGFDITVASELMAILCLATSLADLKRRVGAIVIGRDRSGAAVTADALGVVGALAVVLKDALAPNLVQTLEHSPALVHGGPFANIAHGCNSLIATRAGLGLGEVVVTEAGFGADLGAEKFLDIACPAGDLAPDAVVVVATVRALKYHGGVEVADLSERNDEALLAGMANLNRHLNNLVEVFGQRCVVALNRFATDTDQEIALVTRELAARGIGCAPATHFLHGGAGAEDVAKLVLAELDKPRPTLGHPYRAEDELPTKIESLVRTVHGAQTVTYSRPAQRTLDRLTQEGHGALPICLAKTQYSFSSDPKLRGAPSGHTVEVREVRLAAGAGFVVVICGDLMTMPGLPKSPAALRIDVSDDGVISGLS